MGAPRAGTPGAVAVPLKAKETAAEAAERAGWPWWTGVPTGLGSLWEARPRSHERRLLALLDGDGGPRAVTLESHRPGTAYAALSPPWLPDASAYDELLAFAERTGRASGALVLRWPEGEHWLEGHAPAAAPPLHVQSTRESCGPSAVLMALSALGLRPAPAAIEDGRGEEVRLWREASSTVGTDPLALARAGVARGAAAEVVVSIDEAQLAALAASARPDTGPDDLARFLEAGMTARAQAAGVVVRHAPFTLADLDAVLGRGGIAVVLIDVAALHGASSAHWITVHAREGEHYLANDPDPLPGEDERDARAVPLPRHLLDELAWFGTPPVRALIALERSSR